MMDKVAIRQAELAFLRCCKGNLFLIEAIQFFFSLFRLDLLFFPALFSVCVFESVFPVDKEHFLQEFLRLYCGRVTGHHDVEHRTFLCIAYHLLEVIDSEIGV